VNKLIFILVLLGCFSAYGQKGSERLKTEQKKLEKQIATTKTLFETSKQKAELSLEEVRLIDQQVKFREQLLTNIDNQIKAAELKIQQKRQRIHELEADIASLKKQYADLLLYAYKMRSKYGKLMYIFSAESIEEAMKRKLYLEKLAEIQQKQLRLIRQNMELMDTEIAELESILDNQKVLADLKRKERAEILVAKKEKERIYQELKLKEQEILAELRVQEQKNIVLQQQIQAEIQREIREEQARIEKARKEAEAKRKAEEAKRKAAGDVATVEPKKEDLPAPFMETKEGVLEGKNFMVNKGKLPWPVEKGTITVNYGKNAHPTLPNVYTQNNGIDISTPKNAVVRAIFDGEVTSVINIPGAGKVVIIKHGNYRSVYSNLQDVYVTKGAKVKTKTPVGSLLPSKDGNLSVAHFEIHEVKDGQVSQLNPNLWIAK
jgi:septal ring factor EnvC (AmiA/AmiB activator)